MPLLCINTCEQACTVLVRVHKIDMIGQLSMQSGHDRELAGLTAGMLAQANVKPAALQRIAVATGPGSFTSSRIGVAFARSLALCGSADIVGVNLLEVLAETALQGEVELGIGVKMVGRGQIAWCAKDQNTLLQAPAVCEPQAFLPAVECLADGQNWAVLGDAVAETKHLTSTSSVDMTQFANLACGLTVEENPPRPWYARPPDAKLPGGIDPWA